MSISTAEELKTKARRACADGGIDYQDEWDQQLEAFAAEHDSWWDQHPKADGVDYSGSWDVQTR